MRDLPMVESPAMRTELLKDKVDLVAFCGPTKDQGAEGSCTGHAYSSMLELLYRKFKQESPVFSPQFLYVQELLLEGSFPDDNGAMPRSGCIVLNKSGCCLEGTEPYAEGSIMRPSQAALDEAVKYRIGAYHRINKPVDVLYCLNSGYPCTIGFQVYSSFESEAVADTGIMPIPDVANEVLLGGHEVLCVGYDLAHESILIQNSWGEHWGDHGRFWMPFACVADGDIVNDIWMCHFGSPWKK